MNKRIIISESEKKRILSQHKSSVQNESELKKQSLSERELSKLVNRVLIQEQLQVPGLPEGMVECIGNLKSIDLKQQTTIATGCKDMDVKKCSEAVMSVGVELAAKVISNPSILLNWGKETMEFAKCMSEKFEMDLPIENLASSKTSEMKESIRTGTGCKSNSDCKFPQKCINGTCETTTALKESGPCKSDSDCPPNMACYNNKCSVTTSSKYKEVKETEEMNEGQPCPRDWMHCPPANQCCPPGSFCAGSQGCRDRQFRKVPGGPTMTESDESRAFTSIIRYQDSPKSKEVKETEEMDETLSTTSTTSSKTPGCTGGRVWCHSAQECCWPGTCATDGCRHPVSGKKIVTWYNESYDTDEIIYEIEIDEEPGELGCCRNSAKPCGPGYYCKCPSGICSKIMPVRV